MLTRCDRKVPELHYDAPKTVTMLRVPTAAETEETFKDFNPESWLREEGARHYVPRSPSQPEGRLGATKNRPLEHVLGVATTKVPPTPGSPAVHSSSSTQQRRGATTPATLPIGERTMQSTFQRRCPGIQDIASPYDHSPPTTSGIIQYRGRKVPHFLSHGAPGHPTRPRQSSMANY